MRIISGAHKGRRIELLKENSNHIRPTSDFAREAIFNLLNHGDASSGTHPYIEQHILDVFCGTGALGLEALSRGAHKVTFIDKSRDALANVRHNANRMKEADNIHCLQADATRLPPAREPFSLVFLDPPYFKAMLPKALVSLAKAGWLTSNALLITEQDAKEQVQLPASFKQQDTRRYGRANIQLLRWQQSTDG